MTYPTEKAQLELISTARQLLNSDYTRRCTEEYRVWSSTNQININRVGEVLLRYPPFSGALSPLSFRSTIAKPTEDDVVKKALELYNRERPSAYQNSVPAVVDPAPTAAVESPPALTSVVPAVATEPVIAESAGPALTDETTVDTSFTGKIIEIFKNPAELITTPAEPEKEESKALTVATFSSEPAVEEPKSASISDRIFDIFRKPAEVPLPEAVAKEEPDPLLEPVVVTESTNTSTDYTVEVPAVEIPEPVAAAQLTNDHTDKIQAIFKDVPKPTGITGLIRRAFSRKESNTGDTS
jgi:hypothetical protein